MSDNAGIPHPLDQTDESTNRSSTSTAPLESSRTDTRCIDVGTAISDGRHIENAEPSVRESRLHDATYRLTPSLYSLNMGTGVVSILLYTFPYPAHWLRVLGIIIFALNIILFLLISAGTAVRYIRWKGLFSLVNRHGTTSMFWGCLPMGLTTIIVSPRCISSEPGERPEFGEEKILERLAAVFRRFRAWLIFKYRIWWRLSSHLSITPGRNWRWDCGGSTR
jgi:hypothetical protein